MTETTEEELQKIIKSNKSKNVKIDGKNYWISKKVKDEIKKNHTTTEGGFLPLLGIIPGIIAGIAKVGAFAAGAAGIASEIASTVSNSREAIKKQKEIELLEKEIAKPKTGSGLYLKPHQATALHKYFKNNTDIPVEVTKKFKDGIEIEVNGDGLYLKPYPV